MLGYPFAMGPSSFSLLEGACPCRKDNSSGLDTFKDKSIFLLCYVYPQTHAQEVFFLSLLVGVDGGGGVQIWNPGQLFCIKKGPHIIRLEW